jgi:hypothetical protein
MMQQAESLLYAAVARIDLETDDTSSKGLSLLITLVQSSSVHFWLELKVRLGHRGGRLLAGRRSARVELSTLVDMVLISSDALRR